MHRTKLLTLLHAYNPHDTDEQQYKKVIELFVKANKDCFERSLEIGHITASSWIVNKENTQALLLHHKKLNIWLQPGGHCDGDPDVLAVALKEAQEESGIMGIQQVQNAIFDIDVHLIPSNKKEKEHYHYDIRFLLQMVSNETVVQNHESNELRWVDKNQYALPTQNRSIIRMFEKWHMMSRATEVNRKNLDILISN